MPVNKTKMSLSIHAQMSADDAKVGNVYINGPITFWAWPEIFNETDAITLRKALKDVEDAETLNVYIDSPGGYLDEGMTMMREIAEHGAKTKNAFLMECCSAATLLALPCHHVAIYEGGEVMIHNPRAGVSGTPKEIIHAGEALQKRADSVAQLYSQRMTGKTVDEIQTMMDEETWMTPREAVEMGFAHEVIPVVPKEGYATMWAGKHTASRGMMASVFGYEKRPARGNAQTSAHFEAETPPEMNGMNAPHSGAVSNKEPEGKDGATMTYEELKKSAPELYKQIWEEGAAAERERMRALDELREEDTAEMIDEAKYGETPKTAETMAIEIIRMRKKQPARQEKGKPDYMKKRAEEAEQMNGVRGGASSDNDPETSDKDEIASMAAYMKEFTR